MIFRIHISSNSSNQQALLPSHPAQPKEMSPFLCHAVPWVVLLLSRAPMHSTKKFQSCGFKNSSCNKSTGISSFHAFIIEINFLLVFFLASFQLQQPASHMYYKNRVIMRYCYNNFNYKCQICFIQENRVPSMSFQLIICLLLAAAGINVYYGLQKFHTQYHYSCNFLNLQLTKPIVSIP